jgi:DNA transformation protein
MAVSASFKTFVIEQLAGLGPVMIRPMFGGGGVYADGVMLGLIASDTLHFKVDPQSAAEFEAEGSRPFSYETSQGTNTLASYWQVPERLYDEPEEMTRWALRALGVARAKATPKRPRKTRQPGQGNPPRKIVRNRRER